MITLPDTSVAEEEAWGGAIQNYRETWSTNTLFYP